MTKTEKFLVESLKETIEHITLIFKDVARIKKELVAQDEKIQDIKAVMVSLESAYQQHEEVIQNIAPDCIIDEERQIKEDY